jgi:hypothetical protein
LTVQAQVEQLLLQVTLDECEEGGPR